MRSNVSKKILRYYSNLLQKHGFDPRSVGWGDRKGKQSLRFEILCQIGKIHGGSLLDVGCGFGDLYGYLKYKKIQVKYLGVDINPELIEIGKKIYPKASLETRDIEQKPFQRKFEWVMASGITSHGSTYPHLRKVIKEMFRICSKGVAMNFVSNRVDYKTKGLFYSSPEKILAISKSLSNRIVLRHDYMPFEFTLYIFKNTKKTSNLIFQEYIKNKGLKDKIWLSK